MITGQLKRKTKFRRGLFKQILPWESPFTKIAANFKFHVRQIFITPLETIVLENFVFPIFKEKLITSDFT